MKTNKNSNKLFFESLLKINKKFRNTIKKLSNAAPERKTKEQHDNLFSNEMSGVFHLDL